ncbi:hypothetical protein PMSD_20625 [Paenibacillus macquariensis subsp. defensor]|nr:hypothetical protein PMSD_20625 [Paenibacillus macquariensis subsp. defensor]
MFCVIQKVTNKKPNPYGAYKELMVDTFSYSLNGKISDIKYTYHYRGERFGRPILDAYKISIHKSYREGGKVKKKQWVICTMGYYNLIEFSLYDCINSSTLSKKLEEMDITEDQLFDMVYEKLQPIIDRVTAEYESTEEFKTTQAHKEIMKNYSQAKGDFEQLYGNDTYDYCFDVFGELRSPDYMERLKEQQRERQEYQERSYQSSYQSNHDYGQYGSYHTESHSTYSEDDKARLKLIFRTLSKKFHPDVTKDDGEIMKLINKLKNQWGI